MAGLKKTESGQWIILMGFVISTSIIILAIIANESTIVGQTTSESILEFPKGEILSIREGVFRTLEANSTDSGVFRDIQNLSLNRTTSITYIDIDKKIDSWNITMHYNNGVVVYHEYTTKFI